jgi:hypothetical protein
VGRWFESSCRSHSNFHRPEAISLRAFFVWSRGPHPGFILLPSRSMCIPGQAFRGLAALVLAAAFAAGSRPLHAQSAVSLSVADVSVFEGNSGTTALNFVIRRSGTGVRSSVSWEVAGATASAGSDFTAVASSSHVFGANDDSFTVPVSIVGDTKGERNETLTIRISSSDGTPITRASATGTILNDDLPAVTVGDVAMFEGSSGTTALNFTVRRDAVDDPSSITVATADATASAGSDYVAVAPFVLTFAAGETTKSVLVQILGDPDVEPDETFTVVLSSPVGCIVADGSGTGTIRTDDDPLLNIADAKLEEGHTGSRPMNFVITRSGALTGQSSVQVQTENGTATGGSDFVAIAPTTVNLGPGQSTVIVAVMINGDGVPEPDEEFKVKLISATGARIEDGTATGTIINDDAPAVSVADASIVEGSAGTSQLSFSVTRSGGSGTTSSVTYATSNGSAVAPGDYAAAGPVVFTFGPNDTTLPIVISVVADTVHEATETLQITLTNPQNATLTDPSAIGTIVDDDSSFSVNDPISLEGNSGTQPLTFTITRAGSLQLPASVVCATSDGTAVGGSDYTAIPATTLQFQANETSRQVTVSILNETVFEPDETVSLVLSSPAGATIADATGVGTIRNDDNPPQTASLAINDISLPEGTAPGSTTQATLTITRSGDLAGTAAVVVGPGPAGTARAPGGAASADDPPDFLNIGTLTLQFSPGVSTLNFSVSIAADNVVEADEFLNVSLLSASGATIADGQGRVTIVNDDFFTLSVSDASATEGNSGITRVVFPILRSGGSHLLSSVSYRARGVTATEGTDFLAASGTITFAIGETVKNIEVDIVGDTDSEPDETFEVTLSSPQNAVLTRAGALGTIRNDDSLISIGDASASEGRKGESPALVFTVTRSGGSNQRASVTYATANGTAFAGSDYNGIPPTVLEFAPGELEKTISVTILSDVDVEPDENFTVRLSSAVGATIRVGVGKGTIVNDD